MKFNCQMADIIAAIKEKDVKAHFYHRVSSSGQDLSRATWQDGIFKEFGLQKEKQGIDGIKSFFSTALERNVTYYEEKISASKTMMTDRQMLQTMLLHINPGDYLFFESLDRLSRSTMFDSIDELRRITRPPAQAGMGANVVFIMGMGGNPFILYAQSSDENHVENLASQIILHTMAFVSHSENLVRARRAKMGQNEAWERGQQKGRPKRDIADIKMRYDKIVKPKIKEFIKENKEQPNLNTIAKMFGTRQVNVKGGVKTCDYISCAVLINKLELIDPTLKKIVIPVSDVKNLKKKG